jgi:hypothetical protein
MYGENQNHYTLDLGQHTGLFSPVRLPAQGKDTLTDVSGITNAAGATFKLLS